jgi:polyisoprenoid-binding protein YceI
MSMTRLILFSLLMMMSSISHAQVYITTTARVEFFSEAPLENISAVNSNAASLINTGTDSVFVRMKNTGFVFKNALMQEHFNENYMESTKYPFDSFKGKIIEDIDYAKDGTYPVSAVGKLTIHGVDRQETIKGTLIIKSGTIRLNSEFNVHTSDFKIEIPKLLFEKIAEEIKVTLSADYKLKK